MKCPLNLGVECNEEELEDNIGHRESFLDCPVPNGFPRVLILHTECFQPGKELIGMEGDSYSRCVVDLCGFPAVFPSSAEVVDEAQV